MPDKPICVICEEQIQVTNPLEIQEGFVHRECWIKKTNARFGHKVKGDI